MTPYEKKHIRKAKRRMLNITTEEKLSLFINIGFFTILSTIKITRKKILLHLLKLNLTIWQKAY